MEKEINFCNAFAEKVASLQGIENKSRFLLEDFFYKEGWMRKTNPKAMKEGYHQEYTYDKSSIAHFIEDFVRLFKREFDIETSKVIKSLSTRSTSRPRDYDTDRGQGEYGEERLN